MWIALIGYALGWYVTAPAVVRSLPDRTGARCQRGGRSLVGGARYTDPSLCRYSHGRDCWRDESRAPAARVILGSAGALMWPLLLIGWDVWRRAKGKRSYAELQRDIEALELGLEADQ